LLGEWVLFERMGIYHGIFSSQIKLTIIWENMLLELVLLHFMQNSRRVWCQHRSLLSVSGHMP